MPEEQLSPELIRLAYHNAIFPMADEQEKIEWYQPSYRALFPLTGIHLSRSLKKVIRQKIFEIRFDTAFEKVMRGCQRPEGTWINEELIRVYTQVHQEGWGHSAECWHNDRLVGGVYGIVLGGCFCAESMFHHETNASKVALWALIERCRELGFVLFDAQIMNSHLASLGAFEVPHEEYMILLKEAQKIQTVWS